MKRLLAMAAAALLSVGVFSAQAKDYVTYDANVLPAQAQNLIKQNFKGRTINHIKVDKDVFGIDGYDVVLSDGTEIDFDSKGALDKVEVARNNAVPDALVMQPIRQYVAKNYPGQKIVQFDVNRNNYEVELTNGLELKFNRQGQFQRVDD